MPIAFHSSPRIAVAAIVSFAVLVSAAPIVAQSGATSSSAPKASAGTMPPAVAAAFKKAYPTAAVRHVSHETEDGVEQYEVESTNQGRSLDVNYKPDGTLLVVEEEVVASDVPAAVTEAVTARYPKATVTRRERATEGTKVFFELGVSGAPVKEVQLTPDGHWISPKPGK